MIQKLKSYETDHTFALMRSAVYFVITFSTAAGIKMSQFSYIRLSSGPL